jgi:hypothetical protein
MPHRDGGKQHPGTHDPVRRRASAVRPSEGPATSWVAACENSVYSVVYCVYLCMVVCHDPSPTVSRCFLKDGTVIQHSNATSGGTIAHLHDHWPPKRHPKILSRTSPLPTSLAWPLRTYQLGVEAARGRQQPVRRIVSVPNEAEPQ